MKPSYRRYLLSITVLIALTLICSPAVAFTGKVVGVSDGDTITVMHNGKGEKVRLYGIDCPEKGQSFGKRAKQFTSDAVFSKTVLVEPIDYDRYGRTVALVSINGNYLNPQLIENGFAWVYTRYCTASFCDDWNRFEAIARSQKAGLWRDPSPVPPWEYRRGTSQSYTRPSPSVEYTQRQIQYHGNRKSRIFHQPSCRYYNCKNCTAVFNSRDDAIAAGFRPCKVCKP